LKVLIIGNGAREHALAWKISQDRNVTDIFVAPGNGGTAKIATNISIKVSDIDGLYRTAKELGIDVTVVGPEAPLSSGIVNTFSDKGMPVFGPTREAAQIESSKVFSKRLMQKYNIPTANGEIFADYNEAREYLKKQQMPVVIKADGLAAGKGVIIAKTLDEALSSLEDIMLKKVFGDAGSMVVIEECMIGKEVSLLSFTDGKNIIPLVPACDYKRIYDEDLGPNTGGMGSYSPPGFFGEDLLDHVMADIVTPTVQAMARENLKYKGVLYTGLMITNKGPKVLEYNARFGDPETQAILPRLKSNLLEIMISVINEKLDAVDIEWTDNPCVGVVMASKGYPGHYNTGYAINGLNNVDKDVMVFHAGTEIDQKTNNTVTAGGRVLTVTATGDTMSDARDKVYKNIKNIVFEGCQYRKDIAAREVK